MARIAGIELPSEKRVEISLRYLYGIGPALAIKILKQVNISPDTRVKNLTEEEMGRLQKVVEHYRVEGDLRREVLENISRLKSIKSYRGIRHMRNLPVRGQRTRSNARTKRGKRITIGTVRKDIVAAQGAAPAAATTKA